MSFILDALKKSESERQRRSTPGIADVPHGTGGAGTPRWIWVLAGLLAVNAAVLLGLWLKPSSELAAADAPTREIRPAAPREDAGSFSRHVAEARRAEPAPADTPPAKEAAPPAPSRSAASESPRAATPAANVDRPPDRPSAATRDPSAPLSTFDELRANGTLNLPELHLDIHVYSDKPGERFVFVNMNKYREQGKLTEGPVIREIRSDGVILEHQGTEFLLPRE